MIEAPKRIFLRPRRPAARLIGAFVAALLATALASCSESTYWSSAESSKQPQVDWVRFDHRVMFDPRGRDLSISERARLEEFLARIEPRYGDQVLVGTGSGAVEGEIGLERVAAVAEYLRGAGLKVAPLTETSVVRWDGAVRISVGRYVVTPPNCPDWSKSASYDPLNHTSSNFGCATATNLGLMVADPGDLIRGRPMGPSDGAHGARAVKAWREGDKNGASPPLTLTIGGGATTGGAQ
jgi:pilus assembly protein CpaD